MEMDSNSLTSTAAILPGRENGGLKEDWLSSACNALWMSRNLYDLEVSLVFPQISILQVALVFVWLIGVNSFPTIKVKKDYPKIMQQSGKQREIVHQLFSQRTNGVSNVLRSRRALKSIFPSVPTNKDRGILWSRTNNMLTVYRNGTIKGVNRISSFVKMERQSFNTSIIRIMAVETGLYVAMEKNGRVVTTKKKDDKSLWIENHEWNSYITYQSYYMAQHFNSSKWFLAIKNNGRIKNGNNTSRGMNSAQFLYTDPVCNSFTQC